MKELKLEAELDWVRWTVKDIKDKLLLVKNLLKKEEGFFKGLGENEQDINFHNLIMKNQERDFVITKIMTGLWALENTHMNAEIRKVAREAKVKISALITEFSFNEEVYGKYKIYFEKYFKQEKSKLTSEEIKYVEDSEKAYKKKGMHLPKKDRKVLIGKINKITKLASKFDENCTKNYSKGEWFKKNELEGVPEDIVKDFKYDEKKKKYFVSIVPSVMTPVVKYCHVQNTRKKITEISAMGVGEANNKLMREVLKLRYEVAKTLSFKTFSDMTMDTQLVNKPADAVEFCKNLISNLSAQFKKDKINLSKYLPKGEKLSYYNAAYLENMAMKDQLKVDQNEIKKYFEFENTLQSMFNIWEKYFEVKIEFERKLTELHEDVLFYSAYDKKTGNKIGTAIFDLFPREGKYGHACVEQMQPRVKLENGEINLPSTLMLCNFQKNKEGKTLLAVEDVSTLFHEGGHMLHVLLGKNNFSGSSPFVTSIDFVEIPSQFMENFLTDKITSSQVAKHVETGVGLSDDLIKKIEKIEDFQPAWTFTGHTTNALFDLELHGKNILVYTKTKTSIQKLYEKFSKKYININSYKKRDWPSRFAHLMHGYESKYYSYIVSKVYSQDAWGQFTSKYKYNGSEYKKLLELANTVEEKDVLENFLGRKPNDKAFVKGVKR